MLTEDVVVLIQLSIADLLVEAIPWREINVHHEPSSTQLLLHLGGREGGREGLNNNYLSAVRSSGRPS